MAVKKILKPALKHKYLVSSVSALLVIIAVTAFILWPAGPQINKTEAPKASTKTASAASQTQDAQQNKAANTTTPPSPTAQTYTPSTTNPPPSADTQATPDYSKLYTNDHITAADLYVVACARYSWPESDKVEFQKCLNTQECHTGNDVAAYESCIQQRCTSWYIGPPSDIYQACVDSIGPPPWVAGQ